MIAFIKKYKYYLIAVLAVILIVAVVLASCMIKGNKKPQGGEKEEKPSVTTSSDNLTDNNQEEDEDSVGDDDMSEDDFWDDFDDDFDISFDTSDSNSPFVSSDRDLGLFGDSVEDASEVVNKALAEGKSIFFGSGVYYFSEPLVLNGQQLIGTGISATYLRYIGEKDVPFVQGGGEFVIKDLTLCLDEEIKIDKAKEGEKVLLSLGEKNSVKNAVVQRVNFENCGTAVYEGAKAHPSSNVRFDTLRFSKFTYSGIQMLSSGRSNNKFDNLYVCSDVEVDNAHSGFELSGSEKNTVVRQLNVEHFGSDYPILFNNCENLTVKTIHIEGANVIKDSTGYVNISKTSGKIQNITYYWTRIKAKNNSCIKFGDANKNGNKLAIGTLYVRGINQPTSSYGYWPAGIYEIENFKFLSRDKSAKNDYTVHIENYIGLSGLKDMAEYEKFPCDENINITKMGNIRSFGTTAERPEYRVCKGFEYYNTELNVWQVWDGTKWN